MKRTLFTGMAASLVVAGMAFSTSAQAQRFLPVQHFDFTADESLIGQGEWLERGGVTAPDLLVVSGNVDYTAGGIPAAQGNSIFINDTQGKDARIYFNNPDNDPRLDFATENNAAFGTDPYEPEFRPAEGIAPTDNQTYYWSSVVSWNGDNVGDDDSYIGGFLANNTSLTTFFRGILRVGGLNGEVYLGTQLASTGSTPTEYATDTPLNPNEPVFVVIKVTEVPGTENDTSELFLFINEQVPSTEPAANVSASHFNPTGNFDINDSNGGFGLVAFAYRQFQSSIDWPGQWNVDSLRTGFTWDDVTTDPAQTSVSDWTLY